MTDQNYKFFNTIATIIDLGSGTVKAGLAGDEKPPVVFESVIGHCKFN